MKKISSKKVVMTYDDLLDFFNAMLSIKEIEGPDFDPGHALLTYLELYGKP